MPTGDALVDPRMRADRLGPTMGSSEPQLEEVEAMGPAMHGAGEVLNDWLRMGIAGGVGVLVATIALALGVDALLRSARRLRDRRSSDRFCRRFAEAAARGDLQAAEDMGTLALARNDRGGRDEWSASCDMTPTRAPR
jgi:hypothetical protein